MSDKPLTRDEIYVLAKRWYAQLDAHAPSSEYEDVLASNIEMHYPEGVFRGFSGFQQWYENVLHLFFDETHTLTEVSIQEQGNPCSATVVVNWVGSFWDETAARSQTIVLDSYHTWKVGRAEDGTPRIATYIVERLEYAPGSARLGNEQTTEGTQATIEAYYAASESGDREAWFACFAEDLVMDEQLMGHIEGKDALRERMAKSDGGYARFQNRPLHTVVDGEQGCVVSHISAETKSGDAIECGVANYFKVRDGLITYMANYHDTKPFEGLE